MKITKFGINDPVHIPGTEEKGYVIRVYPPSVNDGRDKTQYEVTVRPPYPKDPKTPDKIYEEDELVGFGERVVVEEEALATDDGAPRGVITDLSDAVEGEQAFTEVNQETLDQVDETPSSEVIEAQDAEVPVEQPTEQVVEEKVPEVEQELGPRDPEQPPAAEPIPDQEVESAGDTNLVVEQDQNPDQPAGDDDVSGEPTDPVEEPKATTTRKSNRLSK